MTLEEYHSNLKTLEGVTQKRLLASIVIPNANELLGKIKNRIILDGENTSGAKMTNYDTTPRYFTRNQFDKQGSFQNKGKTGKPTKNTMYLPGGYKELRGIQGKETAFVNYEYTGTLMLSYQAEDTGRAVLLGFTTQRSATIRKGLEDRRGKAFYASREEIAAYTKAIEEETEKLTLTLLQVV